MTDGINLRTKADDAGGTEAGLLARPAPDLRSALAHVSALLLSVSILLMGNGLQGTLIPVRANLEAFRPLDLGLLGTAYFLGFTLGCVHGPKLVSRSGHIRAYLAMTSVASVVSLLHVIYIDPLVWQGLRAITGYCFAVLYIVIESWLNDKSANEVRGSVFSVYTMINLTVITAGQLMLMLADPGAFNLFALASILVSLAAVPIAFTMSESPMTSIYTKPRIPHLMRVSPVGFTGCVAVGLANGSFWSLGPVYAQNMGLDFAGIAYFMSAAVLGGAAAQWPLGWLSDRMDRRRIMLLSSGIALAAALTIIGLPSNQPGLVISAAALFGAGAFPLYTLAVAHANDNARPSEYVEVSSGLLLVFGIGAAAGSLLTASLRQLLGIPTLFACTAAVHVALMAFIAWRMTRRGAPAAEDRVVFREAAIAAQTISNIDRPQSSENRK